MDGKVSLSSPNTSSAPCQVPDTLILCIENHLKIVETCNVKALDMIIILDLVNDNHDNEKTSKETIQRYYLSLKPRLIHRV
jgi:hypothetical protein